MDNNRHNPEVGLMFAASLEKHAAAMAGTTQPMGFDRASQAVAAQMPPSPVAPPQPKRKLSLDQAIAELGGQTSEQEPQESTPTDAVASLNDDVDRSDKMAAHGDPSAGGHPGAGHPGAGPSHNDPMRQMIREALRDAGVLKSDKNLEAARNQYMLTCLQEIGKAMGLKFPHPPDEEALYAEQMEQAKQQALDAAQDVAAQAGQQQQGAQKPAKPFDINGRPDLGALAVGGGKVASVMIGATSGPANTGAKMSTTTVNASPPPTSSGVAVNDNTAMASAPAAVPPPPVAVTPAASPIGSTAPTPGPAVAQ